MVCNIPIYHRYHRIVQIFIGYKFCELPQFIFLLKIIFGALTIINEEDGEVNTLTFNDSMQNF